MSGLARAVLRLAAVAALRDVTIAETRLFDSDIGPIEDPHPEDAKPVCVVYTGNDEGDALSSQNGGPPFRSIVDLSCELSLIVAGYEGDTGKVRIAYPETNKELEFSLDIFEAQVEMALFESLAPLSVLFRKIARRPHNKASVRFTMEKNSPRLAIRHVTWSIEIPDDPMLCFDHRLQGLDRLQGVIGDVVRAWPDALPEKQMMVEAMGPFEQPKLPLFKKLRINPVDDLPSGDPPEYWTPPDPPAPQPLPPGIIKPRINIDPTS